MSKPGIIHLSETAGGSTRQLGPYALTDLIAEDEEITMTAYRVTIAPGSRTAVSYHPTAEELYYVLSGSGVAILDGVEYPLAAGDFLRLPANTRHGFVTKDTALTMLDVHSPGSRPDRNVCFEGDAPAGFGPQ